MIDVNALVDALVRLTAYAGPAGVFVAADTGAVSVPDMITALARGAGVQPRLFACPPQLLSTALHVLGQGEKADQLLGDLVFDSRALAAACGWRPVTDPVPGLQAMGRALAGVT
jgi:nucleoside-diphosphate-sugar epimerase